MKRLIKKILLKRKNIYVDRKTNINFSVESRRDGKNNRIIDSQIRLKKIGYGCFLEHVYGYGEIELGNYVSISGPGTILHAEIGKISIGSFSSIAGNVSIQEFNHDMSRVTTSTILSNIWGRDVREDFISKGDIIIEEDVWIGSNVVILSGVTIGRGSVIAAGSVITKDVPRYSVMAGVPGKVIKKRFDEKKIEYLEKVKWWEWSEDKIMKNYDYFVNGIEYIK